MDAAKPGHTVEFQGLKGASYLNGTRGTLIGFIKKEQRWAVRCNVDNQKVCAKPENLILHRQINSGRPVIGADLTPAQLAKHLGPTFSSPSIQHVSTASSNPFPGTTNPNDWATGLSKANQYEWFSNCYQMRCDDDYQWGGCNLHGPYDPDATPQSLADDFLVYCLLAHRFQVVPAGWDWPDYLKTAAQFIPYAFQKSDAKERWGGENYFAAQMGGRSLRFTGQEIYGSPVDQPAVGQGHAAVEEDVRSNKKLKLQEQVGGVEAWKTLVKDLGESRRFA